MAVASTGKRDIVEATLRATGTRGLFEEIVPHHVGGRTKPAPDRFLEAVRRLGMAPEECTIIEDSDEAVEAARRAGMSVTDVRSIYIHEWPARLRSSVKPTLPRISLPHISRYDA